MRTVRGWLSALPVSVAQEFFDGLQFGFGHVQILFGAFGILLLHGELSFREICFHALLGRDNIAAEAVAGSGLLALEIVKRLRDGGRAAVDVVVAMLNIFGFRSFRSLGLGGGISGLRVLLGFRGRLLWRLRGIAT